jgi:hypothetical protein
VRQWVYLEASQGKIVHFHCASALPLSSLFPAFNFAHLARWNAAIFLRAAADIVRFTGDGFVVFTAVIECEFSRGFCHLARCARAILRRDAADIVRPT